MAAGEITFLDDGKRGDVIRIAISGRHERLQLCEQLLQRRHATGQTRPLLSTRALLPGTHFLCFAGPSASRARGVTAYIDWKMEIFLSSHFLLLNLGNCQFPRLHGDSAVGAR